MCWTFKWLCSFPVLVFLSILIAVPASAQEEQVSVKLNVPTLANEYLSVTNKSGLEGMTAMTIEAWIYPTTTDLQTIVGNDYRSSYWLGIVPSGNPTYPFKIRYYPTGGAGNYVEGVPAELQLNRWSHIAVTYDVATTTWRMYVNNATVASGNTLPSPGPIGTSAGDLRIGADREGANADYFFRGYLDEVRIWGAALNGTTLGNVWLAGAAGARYFTSTHYAGLRAWWTMWGPAYDSGQFVFRDERAYLLVATFHYAYAINGAAPSLMAPPVDYNVAVRFEGAAEYAQHATALEFSGGLTIEAWISPTSLTGYPTIAGRDFTSSFWLGINPAGNLRFYPRGGVGNFVQSVGTISTTRWTQVAATYRDGRTCFYIDGNLDSESSAISGPVGENGLDFFVGADNSVGGAAYFYNGLLDEVRVTNGELTAAQIRSRMFVGNDRTAPVQSVYDSQNVLRTQHLFSFGINNPGVYTYGNALRVRSGAPLASPLGAYLVEATPRSRILDYGLDGFWFKVWPSLPAGSLPAGTAPLTTLDGSLVVTDVVSISDLNVFVSLPSTALTGTGVNLRHPDGTTVTLLAPAAATGRGLHTVFDDQATLTLASGFAPYVDGVRPSFPLSALDNKPANGTWTLEVTSAAAGNPSIGLWAFGLSINRAVSAVGDGMQLPRSSALRSLGANPNSGAGTLEFDLPASGRAVLSLYDLRGRRISTIENGIMVAGTHRVHWNVPGLPAGVYFLRLTIDGRNAGSVKIAVVR